MFLNKKLNVMNNIFLFKSIIYHPVDFYLGDLSISIYFLNLKSITLFIKFI